MVVLKKGDSIIYGDVVLGRFLSQSISSGTTKGNWRTKWKAKMDPGHGNGLLNACYCHVKMSDKVEEGIFHDAVLHSHSLSTIIVCIPASYVSHRLRASTCDAIHRNYSLSTIIVCIPASYVFLRLRASTRDAIHRLYSTKLPSAELFVMMCKLDHIASYIEIPH
jgi:hypothetical protein